MEENTRCLKLTGTTGLAFTCDTSQVKSFPVVGKNFIFKEELLIIPCVSAQVRWAAAIAAKSPLLKEGACAALVAEVTCAAAAVDEGAEGEGLL